MTAVTIAVVTVLLATIALQEVMTWGFLRALVRWRPRLPADHQCPRAAVVLCLRGADPFLPECLRALLRLDYPRYDVLVVVDSRDDPAWRAVERVLEDQPALNIRVEPLVRRRSTCSLKCSSLAQAVSALEDSHAVVALVDADTIPHATWLRELVGPLADPAVGAATGNRWYMPARPTWGSLIRYLWNAAAVVEMYWHRIPWGGTLALKTKVLRDSDLMDRWTNALCEDTMLPQVLRRQGLRVAFVPSLMMVNRETCGLGSFLGWVRRQLLCARLYHPGWPAVVANGLFSALQLAVAAGMLVLALARRDLAAAAWIGSALACYLAVLVSLLAALEGSVRKIVATRGEPVGWCSGRALAGMLPSLLWTQIVYPASLISSLRLRNVEWRGIHYRIDGPFQVRLLQYRPHVRPHAPRENPASL
jgi:hypothetical protein